MATITVRVPDEIRDKLQARADQERQTLSDFVRDRLEDAVFVFGAPERREPEVEHSSLTTMERHTLSLLHRILGRVLPEDANDTDGDRAYQLERAAVLEEGFTSEYWVEFAGLHPELTVRQCEFVMDVLDMFRIAQASIDDLRKHGTEVASDLATDLAFRGFDHNDPVEGHMSDYVRFLVKNDKWSELEGFVLGRDRGNSHHRMLDTYSRMLTAYREAKQGVTRDFTRRSYLLNIEQLEQIAAARVHPSNR